MLRSDGRILTTHAGSLPRPAELVDLLTRANRREPVESAELQRAIETAVPEVVRRQADVGIDIANDGEQARESFFTYVQHRMTGFGGAGDEPRLWQDVADFPGFGAIRRAQRSSHPQVSLLRPPQGIGEVRYVDDGALAAECERLGAAVATLDSPFAATFLTAPSPGIIAAAMTNRHYPTQEAYLTAVADALAVEYRTIVEAGHLLQIDAPDLAMEHHGSFSGRPEAFLAFVDAVVDQINRTTAGLPRDRIRLHVCWGNYGGPHTHDIELAVLLPHLLRAEVGGFLLSMANPRHEHEYRELATLSADAGRDDLVVAVGVIDVTTNYVEHPAVVADRIERAAIALGDPTRVHACTDCGFDTAAGFGLVAPDVAWAKLAALRAGADLASSRLFG